MRPLSTRHHSEAEQIVLELAYKVQTVLDLLIVAFYTIIFQFSGSKLHNVNTLQEMPHPGPQKEISIGETIMVAAFYDSHWHRKTAPVYYLLKETLCFP